MKQSVGLFIPTYQAQGCLHTCLQSVLASPVDIKILIIDSSSSDGTVNIAKKLGVEVIVIPQSDFNHGATREMARKHLNTDIVIMMTQDAIPENPEFLARLIKPLQDDETISVSYARQLPHHGADIFEAFPREFNYTAEPEVRSIQDLIKYGVFTFFCSDSCSAYKNAALDEIGGFQNVIVSEDYYAVAAMLQKGYKIAYAADSEVRHSHRYTLKQEFQRYFDTGYVRAQNPEVQKRVGNAENRGAGLVKALLIRVLKEKPWLIPYAIIQSGAKWLGYRAGYHSQAIPKSWKIKLSSQKSYWVSKYYK